MRVARNYDAFGLLPRWAAVMDESLFRLFQVAGAGVQITDTEDANRVYVQYEREQIAAALNRAVTTLTPYLGFYPRPVWRPEPVTITLDRDMHWTRQTLQLDMGYLVAFGQRATSLIEANVPVLFSDTDSDSVDDTATLTVTTTVDAGEIQVFYRAADGAPDAAHPHWRIEPLTVTDNGATVTITGDKALFVHPNLWATPWTSPNYRNPVVGDIGNGEHFVGYVDVYRVYNDPTGAVTVIGDANAVTPPDNAVAVTADILNPKLGTFRLRLPAGGSEPVVPRVVQVYTQAGYPETIDGLMHPALEHAVIHFANTFLVENPTKSARPRELFEQDFKSPEQGEYTARLTWYPPEFGVKRGAIAAWDTVKQFRIETLARIPAGANKRE